MKLLVNKILIVLLFICLADIDLFAQAIINPISLQWPSDTLDLKFQDKIHKSEIFPRYNYKVYGNNPAVFLKIKTESLSPTIDIKPLRVSNLEIKLSQADKNKITEKIDLNVTYGTAKGEHYALIEFLPILLVNGLYQKIETFEVLLNTVTTQSKSIPNNKSYKSNSVLASGEWYKIALKEEGIYKLDINFFKSLGLNINNINPKNLRLFGNGGGLLPQENRIARTDDLEENSIRVIGEEDGKFDEADFVLFYAKGSLQWKLNSSNNFQPQQHIYADSVYYFLKIDNSPGKRISTISPTTTAADYQTEEFDERILYEKDLYTLITSSLKSGRNWFGEDFEFTNSRNFNFDLKGYKINTPIFIETALAIRANSNTSANLTINSQNIYTINADAVSYGIENDFAKYYIKNGFFNHPSETLNVTLNYNKTNSLSNAWLDYINLNFRKKLDVAYLSYSFRDLKAIGKTTLYRIHNLNNINPQIWNISNPLSPININFENVNSSITFKSSSNQLEEFYLFTAHKTPKIVGKVFNQNLHGLSQVPFLIISPNEWKSEAIRLGEHRKAEQGLSYHVVDPQHIFNEFSSGAKDATAIRDFIKMFYDRAAGNTLLNPKYVLLFGKGSFDNRSIKFKENNFIVTYQSRNSVSPTESYTSDDYFGLLDNNEGLFPEDYTSSTGLLDVAIGRIPVTSLQTAKIVVDKLITYSSNSGFGDWRNKIAIIADDEDSNLHLDQAEANARLIQLLSTNPNIDKIYFDAFQQQIIAGGARYPEVEAAINDKFRDGSLLINYTGHGGESGLAEERVLTINSLSNLATSEKLPIIFTATCSFSRWDDPESFSAGELSLLKKESGSPGLFSTTRVVFASYNFDLNQSFLRTLFQQDIFQKKICFGDVFKEAKNNNIGGLNINSRNFTLLGDPTTLFPAPIIQAKTLTINNQSTAVLDTLKAGEKVLITGIVTDVNGNIMNNYNGIIYPTIYDKPRTLNTLGQDKQTNGSLVQSFSEQDNIIYKGKATIKNGNFAFEFIVPKDIALKVDKGKISYYGNNADTDLSGAYTDLLIGDISNNLLADKIGPTINLYMNNEQFVDGGITHTNPVLIAHLEDLSGINSSGIGIGHDIVATLSGATAKEKTFVLNQNYQTTADSYQKGTIRYQFNNLEPGKYTLKLKAWDVFNNPNEQFLEFEVKPDENISINRLLNYPNPFFTKTSFEFEHNIPNEDLEIQIIIKSVFGRIVKTINQQITSNGNRVSDIIWDGKDDFGDKLARGVYIYELKVRSIQSGKMANKLERLIVL